MAKLSEQIPIYDITPSGVIISDTKGSITLCYKMSLPPMYVLSPEEFEDMVETFHRFLLNLGEEIIVHKQDYFFRELFSSVSHNEMYEEEQNDAREFVKRAYQTHFNERPFLNMESYLYITKMNNTGNGGSNFLNTSLMSKEFANTDIIKFQQNIDNNKGILEKFDIKLELIKKDELIGKNSILAQYLNFNKNGEEIKDISFEENKIYVGTTEVRIYTIENEKQFSTNDFKYHSERQGLPVSYFFPFSFSLAIPHVVNQYIYVPTQNILEQEIQKRITTLKSFDFKRSNEDAINDLAGIILKKNELGSDLVYYHCNIMCFDETEEIIEGEITQAFSDLDIKKKLNTHSRKDLFWAGFPSNATRLVQQKKYLMSLLIGLEASVLITYEGNNQKSTDKGILLCDRIYGIPFRVDIYNEPLKRGIINNQNMTVMSGSGGGKSYFASNLFVNEYFQGGHIFCIDASYSYRLQCLWRKGVYLTFDDSNKITFNPFYLSFLDCKKNGNEEVKKIFSEKFDEGNKFLNKHSQLLQERINTLLGVLIVITKGTDDKTTRLDEILMSTLFFDYFKDRCLSDRMTGAKFDDFYEFASTHIFELIEENKINEFNPNTFLFMLKQFCSGNQFGYLLNSEDERIKTLDEQRFVVIDVAKITDDKILYGIVSVLAMDLYNQKISKLPMSTIKILCVDEAWQAFASPEMAGFLKKQVKIVRKYGGRTIFISQELNDFISSEVLKESIINNSAIKVFLDMKDFVSKFDVIQKVMGISDVNKAKILSLNDPKLMKGKPKYKEVCICTGNYGAVYAVEVPYEIGSIFETNPDNVVEMEKLIHKYDSVELASTIYAENKRNT